MHQDENWPWADAKIPAPIGGAPAGGYLAAFAGIPYAIEGRPELGVTLVGVLSSAIAHYFDSNAFQVPPDDVTVKVVDGFLEAVDKYGLGSQEVLGFVSKYMQAGKIRAGFYKICKDLGIKYAEWRSGQAGDTSAGT